MSILVPNYTSYIQQDGFKEEEIKKEYTIPRESHFKTLGSTFTNISSRDEDVPQGFTESNERSASREILSDEYIAFNTFLLINKIDSELAKWEKLGTENAIVNISNIKDLLTENEEYLIQKSENRILLSLLQLLFENNNWENIDTKAISDLRTELNRFKEGQVKLESLKNFSKQLFRKRFSLLKVSSKNEKNKTKQ